MPAAHPSLPSLTAVVIVLTAVLRDMARVGEMTSERRERERAREGEKERVSERARGRDSEKEEERCRKKREMTNMTLTGCC